MKSPEVKPTTELRSEENPKTKRPYTAPSFRFDRVFETSALACGKVASQASCKHAIKKS